MSRLAPSILALDKGLNLQTAKILAPEGSVLDSLNYEQVDFQGQKRIDGYARYDGSVLPALDDFVLVRPEDVTLGDDGRNIARNAESGEIFGIRLGTYDATYDWFALINENALPEVYEWGRDYQTDIDTHYTQVLTATSLLRSVIESLPGAVIGLHWFRDRLYAVADLKVLQLTTIPAEGTVYPNDLVSYTGSTATPVLDVLSINGTTYLILPEFQSADMEVTVERNGNVLALSAVYSGLRASFFESRTEPQVISETGSGVNYDFGWRFSHLGWAVPFVEGSTLFGALTSLNQNRQGVGTEGPTSTSGDNGKPRVLTQKVDISNAPVQVNGWKTSTSPTSFNLEVAALDEVDQHYIYADAYLSWDGATGDVSAPGITGEGLVEYPANNTVVVDI